jgi:bacteriocin biosynthesis cyclodehydratase domain-containing protein
VAHYVLDPEVHGQWLRRDIPHLPVVYADTRVAIGPVVEPGVGPCLYCLQRYRTDADAAWPAIASQLWGRRSLLESPLVVLEAAALVTRLALERVRSGEPAAEHRTLHLSGETGRVEGEVVLPHPECGCTGISAAARPGTDWPAAARRGRSRPRSSRSPPTTGSASGEPA